MRKTKIARGFISFSFIFHKLNPQIFAEKNFL